MDEQIIHWSEEAPLPDEPVFNALIVIVNRIGLNHYLALGTGFIVSGGGDNDEAVAISAAHVFEEIYHRQNPKEPQPWRPFSAEEAQKVDLDPDYVFGFSMIGKAILQYLMLEKPSPTPVVSSLIT
jgi:hypothetical protein